MFSLRPITSEDIPALVGLIAQDRNAQWTEDQWAAEVQKPQSRTWVLTDDETDEIIVGVIHFWILLSEGEILNLFVHSQLRCQGWGVQMLRKALDQMRREEVKVCRLEVRKSNDAAVQLYQKNSFTITRVRKSYYPDGEDAYEMMMHFDPSDPEAGFLPHIH